MMVEPRRREKDECPYSEFCDSHEYNTAELNKQRGYWKLTLTMAGSFFAMLLAFGIWQTNQTIAMRDLIASLDKSISSYTYAAAERHIRYEERFRQLEKDVRIISRKDIYDDE